MFSRIRLLYFRSPVHTIKIATLKNTALNTACPLYSQTPRKMNSTTYSKTVTDKTPHQLKLIML